ncbi:MAG: 5-oxoprolinase subunit PxpA [Bacteroidota bacterium]
MRTIDLNCDMGESWYNKKVGNDQAIMPHISSCNLACGFHGGDALSMQQTIKWALEEGVSIGAHPSYPDRKNFGRVKMDLSIDHMRALMTYQISALKGMVESMGGQVRHLKPHGVLYHTANVNLDLAQVMVETAYQFHIPILFGPPSGFLRQAAERIGLHFASEGFADRVYESDLRLRSRQLPDALLHGQAAIDQAVSLARQQEVSDANGQTHSLSIDTICLHGDHPGAALLAKRISDVLSVAPVAI